MNIASGDPLRAEKLDLLHKHDIETDRHPNGSDSGGTWFSLRFVSNLYLLDIGNFIDTLDIQLKHITFPKPHSYDLV